LKISCRVKPFCLTLLTPFSLARKAIRLVNTEQLAAFGAGPLFPFRFDEMPDAELPDVLQIGDHTHAILGSIPLIQMVQPCARKIVATKAVSDSLVCHPLTILDPTGNAGFRLETVVTQATRACFSIPGIGAAKTAVHSARGD